MALNEFSLIKDNDSAAEKNRIRSECKHVQPDLALHTPQNKSMVANSKMRI